MAENQNFERERVNSIPTTGLVAGTRYDLNVGGGKYKTVVISNDLQPIIEAGSEFIEKDTIAQFRAISSKEIWAIQNGYYKGVKLNGYYIKGDIPATIDYYISSTIESDNGGSVIIINNTKFEHNFIGTIFPINFGVNLQQNNNFYNFEQYINSNSKITNVILLNDIILNSGISWRILRSNLLIEGNGNKIYKSTLDEVSVIDINGSYITLSNLVLEDKLKDSTISIIKHNFGDNLKIKNCKIGDSIRAYQCFAFDPITNSPKDVYGIIAENCEFYNLKDGLILGQNSATSVNGNICDIKIHGNTFTNGKGDSEETGGDAIKTVKKCYNITITSNYVKDFGRDAVDLYASGDKVIITSNQFIGCRVKAIDIKSNRDEYLPSVWGNDGVDITICNNLFQNNLIGIAISRDASLPSSFNYSINISNNNFLDNITYAIGITGKYVVINSNLFRGNGYNSAATNFGVIYLGDNSVVRNAEGCIISSNLFLNNGKSSGANYAVLVQQNSKNNIIVDNQIYNDLDVINANQTHGFYLNNNTLTKIKNNSIKVDTPFTLVSGFRTEGNSQASYKVPINVAGFNYLKDVDSSFIARISVVSIENIPLNTDNYIIANIIRRRSGVDTTLASFNQSLTSLTSLNSLELTLPTAVSSRLLEKGDILIGRIFHTGTPTVTKDLVFEISLLDI